MQIPAPDAHQCVIGVAIALPSHYAAQVRAVREAAGDPLAEVVPPHITLLPPTAVDVDSLDEVMRHLRDVAAGTSPFEVRLDEVGTFRPVKVEDVTKHHMHSEHYHLPKETADLINETHARGKRVIGVGTTSCRTVESVATKLGEVREDDDDTSIFIYPGYRFKVLDGLITNFHLPESTLIMLVSAFAGYEHTMRAYETAVKENYRFFSFGDSMLIL